MMSPSDLLATPVLNTFRTLQAIIIARQNQNKLLQSMSNKVPSSEVTREFYELILRTLPQSPSMHFVDEN